MTADGLRPIQAAANRVGASAVELLPTRRRWSHPLRNPIRVQTLTHRICPQLYWLKCLVFGPSAFERGDWWVTADCLCERSIGRAAPLGVGAAA